jgi:predicted metal-dependent HD superfamily phosphohydrolase
MDDTIGSMKITFDQQGFGVGDARVQWSELIAVGVRTTSDGPFAEDVFWQFFSAAGLIELPGSLVEGAALTAMQQALPGLDSAKVITAMGSTSERTFRLWHVEASRWRWNAEAFAARFEALVARLGGQASTAAAVFVRLLGAWTSPGRRYHDLEHLAECLHQVDLAAARPAVADLAELALWYHDAVWAPGAPDAEARSAALLEADAGLLGLPREVALAAGACVRATAHASGVEPNGPAAELVVDADLAILASEPLRFLEYEYGVAEEHAEMAGTTFILARGRFLAELAAAPVLFRSPGFRDRSEAPARANLSALLASPRYRVHRWLGGVYGFFARRRVHQLPGDGGSFSASGSRSSPSPPP